MGIERFILCALPALGLCINHCLLQNEACEPYRGAYYNSAKWTEYYFAT